MSEEQTKFHIKRWQWVAVALVLWDITVFFGAFYLALLVRYDLQFAAIPQELITGYYKAMPLYILVSVLIFGWFKMYSMLWHHVGAKALISFAAANLLTVPVNLLLFAFLGTHMPVAYFLVGIAIQLPLTSGMRFAHRFYHAIADERAARKRNLKRVMIVGAGDAGALIAKDIWDSVSVEEDICCFIDDDRNKWGRSIGGVPVYGGRGRIMDAVEKYAIEKIYIAIPTATQEQKRKIFDICKETGCELKNLPSVYRMLPDEVGIKAMKNVSVEDLLGRDSIKVRLEEIFRQLRGKRILVTGGGGSIGSELCRQIAKHDPEMLIIFDIYENNAYDIQQELTRYYPEVNLKVIIGSVRDSRKLWQVFETYRPEIVFHAAAHKHVPLMEDSPCESVKNNVIGTYKTAYAAMAFGCKRFVLISTDKAVNPTNVMGASKRICEMIVQSFQQMEDEGRAAEIPQLFTHPVQDCKDAEMLKEELATAKTEFVAVRFGNVLGSNGSVIPLFKKQIEDGGPVTVTHPDIIRYFMTIPEAVSLVLQAGVYARGGEIFVLDMGEPVKIDDLARNLIKLSGFVPDKDIRIVYTGLRKGEKLYEEKLLAEEGLRKTPNSLIHIGNPIPFDTNEFLEEIGSLMEAAYNNKDDIRERVQGIVKNYKPVD